MTARNDKKERQMKKEILSWIGCFAIAILAALFIVTFVGQRVQVDGHSMEDTLQDRDNLICEQKDKRWIKRIIGLPGETVRIDEEGNIYINGEILDEHYGKEVIQDPGLAAQEITLGEDEYWCMGDNRNHSSDSRVIGPVPRSRILGKAFIRIYPFSKFGLIHK